MPAKLTPEPVQKPEVLQVQPTIPTPQLTCSAPTWDMHPDYARPSVPEEYAYRFPVGYGCPPMYQPAGDFTQMPHPVYDQYSGEEYTNTPPATYSQQPQQPQHQPQMIMQPTQPQVMLHWTE